MADEEKNENGPAAAPAAAPAGGKQLIVLALVMMLTILGSVAGAVYWLMKSGRLPVQAAAAAKADTAKADPSRTRMLLLDPLLVNLADTGGAGYLRLVVALRIEDPPPVKGEKPKEEKPAEKGKVVVNEDEARLRDAALAVLGRQTSERLLAPDGKARLKEELRATFAAEVPELKVTDILYTEFLVQR